MFIKRYVDHDQQLNLPYTNCHIFYVCSSYVFREDLVSILAEVNRDVSEKIGKTSGDRLASQIPEARVRLTRKVYLTQVKSNC